MAALAYWNVNLPEEAHTDTCPPALQNICDKDAGILRTPNHLHHTMPWAEVRDIVTTNTLTRFRRSPRALRKYLFFQQAITERHGSPAEYMLRERLQWDGPPVRPRGKPFEYEADDVKILQNDWPYSIDRNIVHLVVWTKFAMPGEDGDRGALSAQTRALIDGYVERTFCAHLPPASVLWFKNWSALKSVHAVEHFHVLLYDPDPKLVANLTNGVVPLSRQEEPW